MTPKEYLEKHPGRLAEYAIGLSKHMLEPKMLAFTEETACNWGGSFDPNFALCGIRDYREDVLQSIKAYQQAIFKSAEKRRSRAKTKREKSSGPQSPEEVVVESPTMEFPFAVKLYGNDDTSYTRFCATLKDAQEVVALLEAGQPLDFNKDFLALGGFISTN